VSAATSVRRPPKTKTVGFEWRLGDVIPGIQARSDAARSTLATDPTDAGAMAAARECIWHKLTQVAENLGIATDNPLMVEDIALRLADERRLWNETARPAGRPSKKPDRTPLASDMAKFVDEMKTRNPTLSNAACRECGTFRTRFGEVYPSTFRRLLREGREANAGGR
jgi:hypothetical protein